jgi:nucleoid DNA-binding protein
LQKSKDLAAIDSSLAPSNDNEAYKNFLTRISQSLASVTKEVAAKNSVTLADTGAFDIRREKNLEFLVNETSIREILGKF